MSAPEFDLSEWDFLPPLDDAALPDHPPSEPDRRSYTDIELIDGLVQLARERSRLAAIEHELLALVAERDSTDKHWCVDEVSAALGISTGAARTKLARATQLIERLPRTLDSLASGTITDAHAVAITDGSFRLRDSALPAFEDRVVPRAGEQSLPRLKQSVRRAVIALDPADAEQRRAKAVTNRQVRLLPDEDGMAWLMAFLPAAEAQALYAKLDGTARAAGGNDDRTMDQRRADALVDGLLTGLAGELPTEHGRRPTVSVVVGLNTLVGRDDEPGWLDGYGPISAEYSRQIAHDPTGTWRRLITDPSNGQLLDYGRTRYRPPAHLAEHVIARDGSCTFPFCNHGARRADLDHIVPFPNGPTAADNLQPLHRRHHNAKTEAGWSSERDPATGETRWTSPQGREYRSSPPARWPLPEHPPY